MPWHSVDASSWEIGPCKFGRWRSFGGEHLRIRGSDQDLRAEVKYYLRLEETARSRWSAVLQRHGLDAGPTVRLAFEGNGRRRHARAGIYRPEGNAQ